MSTDAEIDGAYARAKEVFATGVTKPLSSRIEKLKTIRRMLAKDREIIERAIITDMRRCE
jgi:acyl-CoA reductase-like NAD-dependent aldehyde dehydrogenase